MSYPWKRIFVGIIALIGILGIGYAVSGTGEEIPDEGKLDSFTKVTSICDDTNIIHVSDTSAGSGRKITINRTFHTSASASDLTATLSKTGATQYVLAVESRERNTTDGGCTETSIYKAELLISETEAYRITVLHNGKDVQTITDSGTGASAGAESSGADNS